VGAWDIFKDGIFWIIHWFYSWCGDWGLAIVFITILFRLLIFPITSKQAKSSYQMQKLQPKMAEIKERYPDDPQRQQQEQMKLYQDAKFNPLSGCLPMLLQMPIFMALYQVLREINDRIDPTDLPASFYGLVPNLEVSAGGVFELTLQGFIAVIPYVIMLILFSGSLVIPMLIQPNSDRNTKIMMGVMAIMMLFFGWNAPGGVLLYWDISSYLGMGQQQFSRWRLTKKDEEEEKEKEAVTPVKVTVDRAERKARPKKKR